MPAVAGAGIGVAGVDHERANAALALEMLPADDHRRGAKAVLREHAGGVRARIEDGEEQIVALPPLDLRGGGAERHARNGQQLVGRGAACSGRASSLALAEARRLRQASHDIACISCRTRRGTDRCVPPSRPRARTAGARRRRIGRLRGERRIVVRVLILDVGAPPGLPRPHARLPACAPGPSARP